VPARGRPRLSLLLLAPRGPRGRLGAARRGPRGLLSGDLPGAERRRVGVVAYNLAVVVDDDEQGIGEVVRGDDLLPATAAQALLCDLLGIRRPAWTHVPLVLGPDGTRLAKRHGAITLAALAEEGLTPAHALAWMARTLELAAPAEQVTLADLLARFDPDRLPTEPTTFTGIRP